MPELNPGLTVSAKEGPQQQQQQLRGRGSTVVVDYTIPCSEDDFFQGGQTPKTTFSTRWRKDDRPHESILPSIIFDWNRMTNRVRSLSNKTRRFFSDKKSPLVSYSAGSTARSALESLTTRSTEKLSRQKALRLAAISRKSFFKIHPTHLFRYYPLSQPCGII